MNRRAARVGGGGYCQRLWNMVQRAASMLLVLLRRRSSVFIFAAIVYTSCVILYMGFFFSVSSPGSVYRTPLLYERLRSDIRADNSDDMNGGIWRHAKNDGAWKPCININTNGIPKSNGYIYVEANGGLNQQRASICNAVAVAGYLNATLVIPDLQYHSVWRDPSKFNDIYDASHFVSTLLNDVLVVDKVPEHIIESFGQNISNAFNFKIKALSSIHHYEELIIPRLMKEKLIRISPFANRLSHNAPSVVQRLRCLANFEALQFSNPILTLAEKLVSRMREQSVSNNGKYIAVHLRFEKDMVAYSCCIYDGGNEERLEMIATRERTWMEKFIKHNLDIHPGIIRANGKCPLTPLEVGLMLRGMGFSNNTVIYQASGEIYSTERTMRPLLEMFPLVKTKETLATAEELAPFKKYSSRMAALDYTVCLHSEVFVTTQGGNFPSFLIGHRRYLYGGHSKTIKPDKRKLALLFDDPTIGYAFMTTSINCTQPRFLSTDFFAEQMEELEESLARHETSQ